MNIWQKAEAAVKMVLEAEFGQQFNPESVVIGKKLWRFDFVSNDKTIMVQVKSCTKDLKHHTRAQRDTRFQRDYIFDCLLLVRVKASRKLFFLAADPDLFDEFVSWSQDLVPEVEMRCIPLASLES